MTTQTTSFQNTVIYHGSNCTDGFTSAYLLYRYFKSVNETVQFIPSNYNGTVPEGLTGNRLFIVDYAFDPKTTDKLSEGFKELILLDHHDSAAKKFGGYGTYNKFCGCCDVKVKFQEEKSGAGMTLDWIIAQFHQSEDYVNSVNRYMIGFDQWEWLNINKMVACVQDRDLWKYELEDTLSWYELLNHEKYNTFEKLNNLFINENITEVLKSMKDRVELREELCQLYASKAQTITFNGFEVPIVNCPSNFSSRVGEILNKDKPFAITYVVSAKIVFLSLRSAPDGENVSEIAVKNGGGGHIHAAGFSFTPDKLVDFFEGKL